MTRIGRIQAGVVAEVMAVPAELQGFTLAQLWHPSLDWVDLSSQPSVEQGWLFNGSSFSAPPAPRRRRRHEPLRIKQGSSLILTLAVTDATGAPLDLAAAQLGVALRTATGIQVGPVTISATDVPGQAIVQGLASDTATWPVGILRMDIAISGSSITNISNTVMLTVEQAIVPVASS